MTAIEWTDTTWNPTTGCDRVSPGCDNCYALTMAKRLKGMGQAKYQRDGDPRTSGPGFGITEHPSVLDEPLRWRKPRRVFVNSMSDLFHDGVSDGFIARVWAVMAATPQHTYQVLTKRHGRLRSLLNSERFGDYVYEAWRTLRVEQGRPPGWGLSLPTRLPLSNVWLGVSVEDQKRADLRVPALLDTPAAVRFLSCEPLLGPVELGSAVCSSCGSHRWVDDQNWSPEHPEMWRGERYPEDGRIPCGACSEGDWTSDDIPHLEIDWVIVGGESGPGARPMHPDWARSLRDQCTAAGVPYFFKQWGDWRPAPWSVPVARGLRSAGLPAAKAAAENVGATHALSTNGNLHEPTHRTWSLERTSLPDGVVGVRRDRKKVAGRELDGRTWDEYPAVAVTAPPAVVDRAGRVWTRSPSGRYQRRTGSGRVATICDTDTVHQRLTEGLVTVQEATR